MRENSFFYQRIPENIGMFQYNRRNSILLRCKFLLASQFWIRADLQLKHSSCFRKFYETFLQRRVVLQRRVKNPVIHLWWSFLRKYLTDKFVRCSCRKPSSWMFHGILNMPLRYVTCLMTTQWQRTITLLFFVVVIETSISKNFFLKEVVTNKTY